MRYTAYTLDGSPIYTADTAQKIGDVVIDHMRAKHQPHIAYIHDSSPGQVWPFSTVKLVYGGCIAAVITPWKALDEFTNYTDCE